jgi:hypothetical protein
MKKLEEGMSWYAFGRRSTYANFPTRYMCVELPPERFGKLQSKLSFGYATRVLKRRAVATQPGE